MAPKKSIGRSVKKSTASAANRRTSKSKKIDDDDEYTPSCDERFDDSSSTSSSDEEIPEPVKKRRGRVKKETKVEKDVKSEISSLTDDSGIADVGFDDSLPDVDKAVRGILEDPENILTPAEVCKCHICDGVFDDTNELEFHLASEHASTSSVVSNDSSIDAESQDSPTGRKRRSKSSSSCRSSNHSCSICNKKFRQKGHLTNHLRLHTGERPFACDICGKRFYQSGHLVSHIRSHTNTRPYECQFCQKKFLQSGHLKNHERLHTGNRPYTCNHCGKGFNQSGHLVNHIRLHIGERPYECEICAKKFTQSGHLNNHMKLHNAERHHECEVCHKRFILPGHLSDHSIIHKTERPHRCHLCPKSFSISCYLMSHLLAHEMPHVEVVPLQDHVKNESEFPEDIYVSETVDVSGDQLFTQESLDAPCLAQKTRPVIIKVTSKAEEENPENNEVFSDCQNAFDTVGCEMDDVEDTDFVSTVLNITRPLPAASGTESEPSVYDFDDSDYSLLQL